MAHSGLRHYASNKPVEVLHLSMPRTGSISMMAAYRILGYTTYHGFDFVASVPHQRIWDRAVEGKFGRAPCFTKSDWESEEFLGPYQVLSDYPVLTFSAEFLDMWPDAKVVLVERDLSKNRLSWHPFCGRLGFCVNSLTHGCPLARLPPCGNVSNMISTAIIRKVIV